MAQFIGTSMPSGFAGAITRGFYDNTVEQKQAVSDTIGFGIPVKLTGGKVAAVSAGTDAVYGFTVREYGQTDAVGAQSVPMATVLRRGYLAVKCTAGTPAAGGKVYLVTATGAITADSASATVLAGATFMGAADAAGIVEISYNI